MLFFEKISFFDRVYPAEKLNFLKNSIKVHSFFVKKLWSLQKTICKFTGFFTKNYAP